jgi:hypothetical protein
MPTTYDVPRRTHARGSVERDQGQEQVLFAASLQRQPAPHVITPQESSAHTSWLAEPGVRPREQSQPDVEHSHPS